MMSHAFLSRFGLAQPDHSAPGYASPGPLNPDPMRPGASAGYANRRSPAALAAALALNGGVVALLIAIPAATVIVTRTPPTPTTFIEVDPVPPPATEPVEPAPRPTAAQQVTEMTVPRPEPLHVDPVVHLDGVADGSVGVLPLPSIVDAGLKPPPPLPAPVLVAAKPDPRYADAFRPAYPPALRREGREGSVTVRVTIDARGRVIAVAMVRATDPIFFEETRRQALKAWRFKPATRDGVAVATEQMMTVQFRLED